LGKNAFKSITRSSSISRVCEVQSNVTKDGSIINVINTPGDPLLVFHYIIYS